MNKKVKLFDYEDNVKTFTIQSFERVVLLHFEIKSGDGVLTVIYPDMVIRFDSSDNRHIDYDDGSWHLFPEDLDAINKMKSHYDTDLLNEKCISIFKYMEKRK